ncbi:MAG: hypothetical protein R2784_05220 [Saprospiraceae bacterium]
MQEERVVPCLTLYPLYAWEERVEKYKKVNTEIPKFRTLLQLPWVSSMLCWMVLEGCRFHVNFLKKYKLEDKVLVNAYENYEWWDDRGVSGNRGSEAVMKALTKQYSRSKTVSDICWMNVLLKSVLCCRILWSIWV